MTRSQSSDRLQLDLLEWGPIERKLAVRRVRCVEPLDKLVLSLLEGHIDPETGYWTMSIAQLADECGLSESSCRRILNRLDTDPRCTFIRWERQRGRTPQFSIIWENIRDAILANGAAGSSVNRDRTRRTSSATADRTLEESSVTGDTKFRQIEGGSSVRAVAEPLYKDLTDLTDINRPPTDLVGEVAACGVVKAFETVATARAIGYSDDQIREVVRHYRAFPGRWRSAGALKYRLELPGSATMPPDQGWPPDSSNWRPAAAQAAPNVDAIPDSDVRRLLPWELQERFNAIVRARGHPRHDPEIRAALEAALMDRSVQERNDREAVGV